MPGHTEQFKRGEIVPGTSYRVEALIGSGGMGSVYRVEHAELGRRFVLKALHGHLASRQDLVARLKNEWRALGKLEHPNIVQVTDAGQTESGLPYYVMEHLRGITLAQLLTERKRLSPQEASMLVVDILAGLHAAHETGAVHRDIKPPNVFIVEGGTAKLLDFGIAKLRDQSAKVVTAGGISIGTPRYMAPEQASGTKVDGRADIYAAALVLYEMVVGRGPFSQIRDPNELVMAHIGQEPERADFLEPTVPPELADLLQRWLSKSPDSRPATAEFARRELLALAESLPVKRITAHEEVTVGGAYEASTFMPPGADIVPANGAPSSGAEASQQRSDASSGVPPRTSLPGAIVDEITESTISLSTLGQRNDVPAAHRESLSEGVSKSAGAGTDRTLGWGASDAGARADTRSPGGEAADAAQSARWSLRRPSASVTPPPLSSMGPKASDSSRTTLRWIAATALVSFVLALGISRLLGGAEQPEAADASAVPNRATAGRADAGSRVIASPETARQVSAKASPELNAQKRQPEAQVAEPSPPVIAPSPVPKKQPTPDNTANSRKGGNSVAPLSAPATAPAPTPAPVPARVPANRVVKRPAAPREPKLEDGLDEQLPESGLW